MLQECPGLAQDHYVVDVEAVLGVVVGQVPREPGRCRNLKVVAFDLAALDILGCGDVDKVRVSSSLETRSILVPSGEVQPVSRSSKPFSSVKRVVALTAFF